MTTQGIRRFVPEPCRRAWRPAPLAIGLIATAFSAPAAAAIAVATSEMWIEADIQADQGVRVVRTGKSIVELVKTGYGNHDEDGGDSYGFGGVFATAFANTPGASQSISAFQVNPGAFAFIDNLTNTTKFASITLSGLMAINVSARGDTGYAKGTANYSISGRGSAGTRALSFKDGASIAVKNDNADFVLRAIEGSGTLKLPAFSRYRLTLNTSIVSTRAQVYESVPEPASWAMMIAGFSMVGAALRRRRSPAL